MSNVQEIQNLPTFDDLGIPGFSHGEHTMFAVSDVLPDEVWAHFFRPEEPWIIAIMSELDLEMPDTEEDYQGCPKDARLLEAMRETIEELCPEILKWEDYKFNKVKVSLYQNEQFGPSFAVELTDIPNGTDFEEVYSDALQYIEKLDRELPMFGEGFYNRIHDKFFARIDSEAQSK